MLNARVRQFMEASTPGDDVVFVVMVQGDADLKAIRQMPDRLERKNAMNRVYKNIKSPIINALTSYGQDGLRVLNNLDGTPQLIVGGPLRAWQKIIEEQAELFDRPDISLIPNEAVATPLDA